MSCCAHCGRTDTIMGHLSCGMVSVGLCWLRTRVGNLNYPPQEQKEGRHGRTNRLAV